MTDILDQSLNNIPKDIKQGLLDHMSNLSYGDKIKVSSCAESWMKDLYNTTPKSYNSPIGIRKDLTVPCSTPTDATIQRTYHILTNEITILCSRRFQDRTMFTFLTDLITAPVDKFIYAFDLFRAVSTFFKKKENDDLEKMKACTKLVSDILTYKFETLSYVSYLYGDSDTSKEVNSICEKSSFVDLWKTILRCVNDSYTPDGIEDIAKLLYILSTRSGFGVTEVRPALKFEEGFYFFKYLMNDNAFILLKDAYDKKFNQSNDLIDTIDSVKEVKIPSQSITNVQSIPDITNDMMVGSTIDNGVLFGDNILPTDNKCDFITMLQAIPEDRLPFITSRLDNPFMMAENDVGCLKEKYNLPILVIIRKEKTRFFTKYNDVFYMLYHGDEECILYGYDVVNQSQVAQFEMDSTVEYRFKIGGGLV